MRLPRACRAGLTVFWVREAPHSEGKDRQAERGPERQQGDRAEPCDPRTEGDRRDEARNEGRDGADQQRGTQVDAIDDGPSSKAEHGAQDSVQRVHYASFDVAHPKLLAQVRRINVGEGVVGGRLRKLDGEYGEQVSRRVGQLPNFLAEGLGPPEVVLSVCRLLQRCGRLRGRRARMVAHRVVPGPHPSAGQRERDLTRCFHQAVRRSLPVDASSMRGSSCSN